MSIMQDFFKAEILDVVIEDIKNNDLLSFTSRFSVLTGEADVRTLTARYEGLTFTIKQFLNQDGSYAKEPRLFVQGSFTKFYHGNNYQNLTYQDFCCAIDLFRKNFNVQPSSILLQNIELGLCIETGSLEVSRFLKEEVIDYKLTEKEPCNHNGKGYTISFPLKNYVVKLYDKGRQCNLNYNALKYEIRIKKMVHLKKMGIRTLYDFFDKQKWKLVHKLLIKTMEDILICANLSNEELSEDEKKLYLMGKNQIFWIKNRPNSKKYENGTTDLGYQDYRKKFFNLRSDFIKLVTKYGLDHNKVIILSKVSLELDRLIETCN